MDSKLQFEYYGYKYSKGYRSDYNYFVVVVAPASFVVNVTQSVLPVIGVATLRSQQPFTNINDEFLRTKVFSGFESYGDANAVACMCRNT